MNLGFVVNGSYLRITW